MFSTVRQRTRPLARQPVLLSVLAILAALALLGHFVMDAANLWPGANAPNAAAAGLQHGTGGRQDAASTIHTGFVVAGVLAAATPVVMTIILVNSRPQLQLRRFAPPLLPPKTRLLSA